MNVADKTCDCLPGFYPDPNSAACIKCPYNCKTCNSPTNCLTCEDQSISFRKNISSSSKCECLDGYFDNGSAICVRCPFNCKTCINSTSCTSCTSDNISNRSPFSEK